MNAQQPSKDIGTIAGGFARLTHPLDMVAVNATIFFAGSGAILAGGAAIVGGCLEPTPAEPLTCVAGTAGGIPTAAGGVFLMKEGVDFFKSFTLPAIETWGSHE